MPFPSFWDERCHRLGFEPGGFEMVNFVLIIKLSDLLRTSNLLTKMEAKEINRPKKLTNMKKVVVT